MGKCKKDITPLLICWSYVFLALTHPIDASYSKQPRQRLAGYHTPPVVPSVRNMKHYCLLLSLGDLGMIRWHLAIWFEAQVCQECIMIKHLFWYVHAFVLVCTEARLDISCSKLASRILFSSRWISITCVTSPLTHCVIEMPHGNIDPRVNKLRNDSKYHDILTIQHGGGVGGGGVKAHVYHYLIRYKFTEIFVYIR